eukprot:12397456-Karenia_brevis.AAC.1
MISYTLPSTGVDELKIYTIHDALITWIHCLGLIGNSHWAPGRAGMVDDSCTLQWVGNAHEQ